MTVEDAANPIVGVDRHRTFFHDHLVAVDGAGNLRDHGLDVGKIGGAGVALGCAHGDEDSLAAFNGPAQIGSELHAAISMPGQQLGQVFFEDGNAAFAEGFHPGFVIVHANDGVAHFGKTDRRHESHISGADYTDGNGL